MYCPIRVIMNPGRRRSDSQAGTVTTRVENPGSSRVNKPERQRQFIVLEADGRAGRRTPRRPSEEATSQQKGESCAQCGRRVSQGAEWEMP
ncbi:hypothetical protein CALVIDRAFT_50549 [Calocera viscosa TUFC12733]|uniref:Uncharacterized protein n=1 Tax=Calocera viscosa (strain TUFC12733) TaxID=1330018 RepID=A0A167NRR8_CALVF|nr:hypothetical protein CALVIDRAFT_50549 [Calocera viscosa TUFC12733]